MRAGVGVADGRRKSAGRLPHAPALPRPTASLEPGPTTSAARLPETAHNQDDARRPGGRDDAHTPRSRNDTQPSRPPSPPHHLARARPLAPAARLPAAATTHGRHPQTPRPGRHTQTPQPRRHTQAPEPKEFRGLRSCTPAG
ncbi:hypothetical protein SAVCW2_24420 [Streptomyces avermitilis]|uniref:Uncharacterized protein n=1 Tax=Streptomyces avermitilis TaxID=33903 RepID=A0A4D4MS18_STRAX|nr:hypothetical protein SAV31267_036640 [Streptomyces avermitilis]GDY83243.1 hypothetical protein SAVCW2_24420 [Streptomyces avermitilis]